MFERYTERARHTIFFARYEASIFGSPYIETEHLLIGVLREDKALLSRLLTPKPPVEDFRRKIEQRTPLGCTTPTSLDLPLSDECKRALAYAAEESDRLSHPFIGTEHLLVGLLREDRSFAAQLLHECGVTLAAVRTDLQQNGPSPTIDSRPDTPPPVFRQPVPAIRVADLATALDFYTNLGFHLLAGQDHDPARLLASGPTQLVLYHQSLAETLLCFTANRATIQRLATAELQPPNPRQLFTDSSSTLLLRDPDGHLLLLLAPQ